MRFTNCVHVTFDFSKSYLLSNPQANTVISERLTYRSRWRRNRDEVYIDRFLAEKNNGMYEL